MPIVMQLRWDGITPGQYDEACEQVGWEVDVPVGGVTHTAWFTNGGLDVLDVWETADDFQRFVDDRLMPVVKGQLNFPGEPQVTIEPAYRMFDAVNVTVRS